MILADELSVPLPLPEQWKEEPERLALRCLPEDAEERARHAHADDRNGEHAQASLRPGVSHEHRRVERDGKESQREEALKDPAKFEAELKQHVADKIGAIAKPEKILVTADLPKTRSGKIMRRLLRDIAEGRALGDVTTLADPTVVAALKDKYEEES